MNFQPAAVLFDFDGVIVNSEPLHLLAFQEALGEERIELGAEEYYRELIGFDDLGAIKHLYEKRGIDAQPGRLLRVLTRKSELTMELIHRRQYHALPGVEALVRGLWRHYPLAICSGARREEIEAMLEGVNLRDCFGIIVAAEDVEIGKPNPMGYLMAAELCGKQVKKPIRPGDCLVVEDAPAVVKSVRSAGFVVLAVTTSYPAEDLAEAHMVVRSLEPEVVLEKLPRLRLGV